MLFYCPFAPCRWVLSELLASLLISTVLKDVMLSAGLATLLLAPDSRPFVEKVKSAGRNDKVSLVSLAEWPASAWGAQVLPDYAFHHPQPTQSRMMGVVVK